MNELANVEAIGKVIEMKRNRVISVDDPFLAFKVIANSADLAYIKRLTAMLKTITEAMES